jgi:hypothetical protein
MRNPFSLTVKQMRSEQVFRGTRKREKGGNRGGRKYTYCRAETQTMLTTIRKAGTFSFPNN